MLALVIEGGKSGDIAECRDCDFSALMRDVRGNARA
jgi:hypothetical protein